jgi:choline dehydrogenase
MMEGDGGAALFDLLVRDGRRQSVFRAYAYPYMDRPNLTVLTHALVTRLIFSGKRAAGVEIAYDGRTQRVEAGLEVVLSLGAIHTPKVPLQSGIGDQAELRRLGIPLVQHVPGVGQNFQDHLGFGCVWEYQHPEPPQNNLGEATFFWKSAAELESPDLQAAQVEVPFASAENAARFGLPDSGWSLYAGHVRPKSRGHLRLTGPHPLDPIQIEGNHLSHPNDLKAAMACVELCREIGNSAAVRRFTKREVMPGNLKGPALEGYRSLTGLPGPENVEGRVLVAV